MGHTLVYLEGLKPRDQHMINEVVERPNIDSMLQ